MKEKVVREGREGCRDSQGNVDVLRNVHMVKQDEGCHINTGNGSCALFLLFRNLQFRISFDARGQARSCHTMP